MTRRRTKAREHSGQKGNAEIDEDALGNLAHADVDDDALQADQRRQHGEKEPGIDAVEEHLEDAVEGDQAGGVVGVAARQLVPHDDHGDAAGEADEDEAGAVFRVSAQEDDGEHEHQHRADDPVLDEREAEHLAIAKDLAQPLVLHLGQRRIHHEDEADGDGDVGGAGLEALKERRHGGHKAAERDADRHGEKDPESQIAVDEREVRGAARQGSRAADLRV